MNRKTAIWGGLAAAAAVAIIWTGFHFLAPPSSTEPPKLQHKTEAKLKHEHQSEEKDGHAVKELTAEDLQDHLADGSMILPGEVSQAAQDKSISLAKLWVTFDSREGSDVRIAQLSSIIPNAADWSDLPAELLTPGGVGWGDPTRYAISTATTPPAVFSTWTFSANGVDNVAVQIPVSARYYSGNDAIRGELDDTLIWQFKFDADGKLIEVTPPE